MKLLPSDPDIQTLVGRIEREELDLQPDFQRGEVWSESKKRRLIDTVLRNWHIPPIHVIERPDSHKQEVLDGQQRLAAIRDFVNGLIRVDGHIEPYEAEIASAHECTYETLPANLRRRFDRFTIRIFSLIDFQPGEPGELFFRLNQPVSLTAAEQRNAFFGPVREQVRQLCEQFSSFGLTDDFLGFSNSRMAYDDTVAKLCLSLERGTLREKITATTITERYRKPEPFNGYLIDHVKESLGVLGGCNLSARPNFKFNKATLFSWLCFTARLLAKGDTAQARECLGPFLWAFEDQRANVIGKWDGGLRVEREGGDFPEALLLIFTDRASLRVSDISSVLLRDAILAFCFISKGEEGSVGNFCNASQVRGVKNTWRNVLANKRGLDESALLRSLDEVGWGTLP